VLRVGQVELRPGEYQAIVEGRRAGLTVREFELLYVLAQRPNRVLSRHEVYERVWGAPMPYRDRSVDVFVRKVRRKLAACSPDWTYIHTHFAIGYRFFPEPARGR
jgi:DNA-binding response OmpR family regulator